MPDQPPPLRPHPLGKPGYRIINGIWIFVAIMCFIQCAGMFSGVHDAPGAQIEIYLRTIAIVAILFVAAKAMEFLLTKQPKE